MLGGGNRSPAKRPLNALVTGSDVQRSGFILPHRHDPVLMPADTVTLGAGLRRPITFRAAGIAIPRWALLLLVAIVARVLTFGNPIVDTDEQFYLVTAQRMAEGALPYVDIWDRKPVGLFLLYFPAGIFDLATGVWIYQFMALASVVGTALLVWRLAERAGWSRGGLVAALLYVFMLNFADGQGGQAPVFYNLLMAAAVLLILPRADDVAGDRNRMARAVLAFLLIGLGLQIKYSMVFEGMFLGLWLMWREHRLGAERRGVLGFGTVLAMVALLPTGLAWATFAAMGHGDAWVYANLSSILARQSDPGHVLLRSLTKLGLILGPVLICAGMSRHLVADDARTLAVRRLCSGWLVAAVLGLLLFGGYINHYALPVMLPMCVCAAGFLGSHPIGRKYVAWPLTIVAALGGSFVVWSAKEVRGDAEQLRAITQVIGDGPACLYVYSGSAILYGTTRRCAPTAWLFPSHISRERENGAVGMNQLAELDRVFAKRPQFVVMRPQFEGERLAVRLAALRHLARDGYTLRGKWPLGNVKLDIWELHAAPATARAPLPLRLSSKS